jgi:DNA processing protein
LIGYSKQLCCYQSSVLNSITKYHLCQVLFCKIVEKSIKASKYLLTLAKNPKITTSGVAKILGLNISLSELFKHPNTIKKLPLQESLKTEIESAVKKVDPDEYLAYLAKLNIRHVTVFEDNYPMLLKEIFTPPAILYYKGELPSSVAIGIVGSRKPTDYGRAVTKEISYSLASAGIAVVSGLALGIDAIAHEAALSAKGKTVAVLGCGLDQIYPTTNTKLAERILQSGAIISEYPPGMPPLRQNFPARNRIISGLSAGLVVTEAAEGSGSLITARDALEQNREVFAVPGAIYNLNSHGPNSLIKLGAKVVTSPEDIFQELGIEGESVKVQPEPKSEMESVIFRILSDGPKHIDGIIKESEKSHNEISSVLTLMEISGKIKHLGGMVYRVNK